MVCIVHAFNQHIVHIDFYIPHYLVMEHLVHQLLIRCSSVFQADWHEFVAKKAMAGMNAVFC